MCVCVFAEVLFTQEVVNNCMADVSNSHLCVNEIGSTFMQQHAENHIKM